MPSDSLMLAVTSGIGVGIFAGIVSGVCYIVVTGFTSCKKTRKSNGAQWHCTICGVHYHSIEKLLESGRVVTCFKCGSNICRARCSKLIKDAERQKAGWICRTCQHPESWFKGILKTLQPSLEERVPSKTKMEPDKIDELDEDAEELKQKEKLHVRGFMERLVEAMLGNNIDNASVARMYMDQKYLPVLGQSPCSAHAGLKLLIQRIIQEAIGLPALEKNDTEIEMSNGEVTNRTYEDFLATAILNKVVENYQEELHNSQTNSISSRISNSSPFPSDKEYYFGTDSLCSKWPTAANTAAEIDAASVSSLEDWVRSDSSIGSTKYVDPVSLKIQQHIEEVSSTDDETKPLENALLPENEWQENWLMQKRAFGRNSSPVPVPMLVPNPSSDAKVLIGDREADDTTDLSDAGSDLEEAGSSNSIELILTSSKTVIGGKNVLPGNELKQTLDFEVNRDVNCNGINDGNGKEENSFMSFESQTEQDTEYTEKYGTLPRTILKSPPPSLGNQEILKDVTPKVAEEPADEIDGNTDIEIIPKHNGYATDVLYTTENDQDLFKGTYSEREKEKWNNAVEMKNNPYSSENLKRRLSDRSTSSISNIFSKDYYIKEPKQFTDTKNKFSGTEDTLSSPTKSKEDLDKNHIYTAKPVCIQPDDTVPIDALWCRVTSPALSSMMTTSSESDLSIERVYNLSSGNVYVNGKSDKISSNDYNVPSVQEQELESIEKSMNFSLEHSTDESMNNSNSSEIINLCDKHLVKDLLGQFSKSYPNLSAQMKKEIECEDYTLEVPLNTKFDAVKPVYSLTARSIPREFREELKKKEEPVRRASSSAIIYEAEPHDSMPFPVAKSKIKFFESLKM